MAELITVVHVPDADGTYHVFSPGDEVPAWAQKAITNPAVWDEPPVAVKKAPAKRTVAPKVATKSAGTAPVAAGTAPVTGDTSGDGGDGDDSGDGDGTGDSGDGDNPPVGD